MTLSSLPSTTYLRCPTCGVVYTISSAPYKDGVSRYVGNELPVPPEEAVALVLAEYVEAGTCNACYKATEAGDDYLPIHA